MTSTTRRFTTMAASTTAHIHTTVVMLLCLSLFLDTDTVSFYVEGGGGSGSGFSSSSSSCQFPLIWSGTWFQSGIVRQVHIDRHTFSTKGKCIKSSGDKFLMEDRKENLFRCVVIIEKHPNVLQYKEAFTDRSESLETLCSFITGDDPLFSMVRVNATPVPCPFKGPYQFTYYRGYSPECENPPSTIDACTDDWRLQLRFQACPDVIGSESTVEELVCLATWKEGSMHYLVGQLERKIPKMATTAEDKYRCFVYEKRKGDFDGHTGTFHLAQSGDATCNGLQTIEGSRTLKLTKIAVHPTTTEFASVGCTYPSWMTDVARQWHTLDWRRTYTFGHHNATLRVTNASGILEMRAICAATSGGSGDSSAVDDETSGVLKQKRDVTLVVHATEGCNVGYICMIFYQRTHHVVELQMSNFSENTDDVCSPSTFDRSSTPYVTLITSSPRAKQCPDLGRYSRLVQSKHGGGGGNARGRRDVCPPEFTSLRMGCDRVDALEFETDCPSEHRIESHECHADWQENGTSFLITSVKGTQTRYCFVYTVSHDKVLRFSSVQDSCRRNVRPGASDRSTAFNVTSSGRCTASSDSGGSNDSVVGLHFVLLTAVTTTAASLVRIMAR